MQNLLNEFVKHYQRDDNFKRQVDQYQRSLSSGEQDFIKNIFLLYKGLMSNDMISRRYTSLSPDEKDIIQKTYYNLNLLFDFLLYPNKWMEKKTGLRKFLSNVTTGKETTPN